ncbi:hypothetical protein [Desulfovibrio psychrotolerans]|uniref:Uncharacterized protein n=1 Tax=Desulfovibrio psychrotolerans TaxID=415242 RepID=A0A7J0BNT7_9BACT|nr:hypothetical protein [Desulfovibrio psychrotolerans]GFM35319.1 hypothetical protein DSM19430T_00030 [Desulfovibrio psychrotolerans]
MEKSQLILSATSLPSVSESVALTLTDRADHHAAALNAAMTAMPDFAELIGPGNENLARSNHLNHFRYMASLASVFDPVSLVEAVVWVLRTYRAQGFRLAYWDRMLPQAMQILREDLPPEHAAEVLPIYQWLIDHMHHFAELSEKTPSFFESLGTVPGE